MKNSVRNVGNKKFTIVGTNETYTVVLTLATKQPSVTAHAQTFGETERFANTSLPLLKVEKAHLMKYHLFIVIIH